MLFFALIATTIILFLIFIAKLVYLFASRNKDITPFLMSKSWMIFSVILLTVLALLSITNHFMSRRIGSNDDLGMNYLCVASIYAFLAASYIVYICGFLSIHYITTLTKVLAIISVCCLCIAPIFVIFSFCSCLRSLDFTSHRSANQDQAVKVVDMRGLASANIVSVDDVEDDVQLSVEFAQVLEDNQVNRVDHRDDLNNEGSNPENNMRNIVECYIEEYVFDVDCCKN